MLTVDKDLTDIRNLIAGIALGVFLAMLGVGLYIESQVQTPSFSCPPGLQIVVGNQVLLHRPNSPLTRNCNITPAP